MDLSDLIGFFVSKSNYWTAMLLLLLGLYAVIVKNNLVKKTIGLSIFQTAIILFYVSIGVKTGGTIPILEHHGHQEVHAEAPALHDMHAAGESEVHTEHLAEAAAESSGEGHEEMIVVDDYDNPVPHVLMLTAIVVGVATMGVALAVIQKIYELYGSIEEDDILERMEA